jgi:RNA polymerase sigma-70 factor (ECF subfamily)
MPNDDMLSATAGAMQIVPSPPAPAGREDDRQIAAGCAAGSTSVFETIYRTHGERMKSIAYNHLGSITDAEDAVQETFLKIHRAASTYSGESSFATWIYRILINNCYDMLRKRRRRPAESPIDDAPAAAQRVASSVDDAKRITLRKLLGELTEQRRSVFTLFEIEGLSHAEIASILGITEGNSKWILFSTKKQLQEMWKSQ